MFPESQNFKDTRQKMSVPLAQSTNLRKKCFNLLRPMTIAMFLSYLSKLIKRRTGRRYARTAAMGTRVKIMCFSSIFSSRCCTRRNLRFHVENCQDADQKQLTQIQAFDLDIELTHGQSGSCRARPWNVDDGLEDIRRIRGLGGEKLPAASNALLKT